jgi:NAD-dependent deacetylase
VSAASLAELLRERAPAVVLTGAGISTESGIPDFRSPTGMWARFDPAVYANVESFRRNPQLVWEFYAPRFAMLTEAQPNDAHRALAELERRGLVGAVVTQNIDMLHERAGSVDVIEVHGSIRTSTCPRCRTTYPLAHVLPLVRDHGAPPCRECGAVLKPDVVFFGELRPEAAIDRAFEVAREAGLLLVIGSSLEVHPVAGLPAETHAAGGKVAIVNRGGTAYDHRADLRIDAGAGETMTAVLKELGA